MGARICALIGTTPGCILHAAIDRAGAPNIGAPAVPGHPDAPRISADRSLTGGAVMIDFSSPEATEAVIDAALASKTPLLVGTTGLSDSALARLRSAAERLPVLVAANTSLGVAVLADAAARAARLLGPAYRCSIVEAHHHHKKDAPSGTAQRLAHAITSQGGNLPADQILSIRGGDVVGEHTIRFAGEGEYLELTHRATSRDLFAQGAIKAAIWLSKAKPGWYTIEDVLGLKSGV